MPRTHIPAITDNQNFALRFFARLAHTSNGCQEWQGCKDWHGYGQVYVNGKMISTHRIAWIIAYGCIPDGLCVLHHCDNPLCCNVEHLFLGTLADNSRDMVAKGRNKVYHGERNSEAKLTTDQVVEIRTLYVWHSHEFGQSALAQRYGVSQALIGLIVRRVKWAHI